MSCLRALAGLVVVLSLHAWLTFAQELGGSHSLAEPGPYEVGVTTVTFVDESREGRELVTEVWYPAIAPEGEAADGALRDVAPDDSGAPYPLLVYTHGNGGNRLEMDFLTVHLASHGYVVAAVEHHDPSPDWPSLINRPLDILLVIDQLSVDVAGDLAGLIDSGKVGIVGFSYGGYTALAMSGAQIDSEGYLRACAERENRENRICMYVPDWDDITAYRARFDSLNEGDLWPATTDERIQAVLAMAPSRSLLLGERGLAVADVPVLIMAGTLDTLAVYEREAAFMYEHLGTADRYLLSFLGGGHFDFVQREATHDSVRHFATAFFGYYLQGQEDYVEYLTAEYVEQLEGLAWGPVEEE